MLLPSFESLLITSASSKLSIIKETFSFAERKTDTLKGLFKDSLEGKEYRDNICIVAVGSYGRYEASAQSDLDVYVLHEGISDENIIAVKGTIKRACKQSYVRYSEGFKAISFKEMLKNIGGNDDTNSSITNRILFLLESKSLYNDKFYQKAYKTLLKKYLADVAGTNKLPRFLLNDIIRYYRTICVDYEFKTSVKGKKWAIRNIKLRFSRKALYFGGIIILLHSINKEAEMESFVADYLGKPFAEKICRVLIDQPKLNEYIDILDSYAYFMKKISDPQVREHLESLKKEDREGDRLFRELTTKSSDFNEALLGLLHSGKWRDKDYREYLIL